VEAKVTSSYNCFKLGRIVELSLPMYLLFLQRIMEQSMRTWKALTEYQDKIVWKSSPRG
jgi:hypothetical protein